MLQKGCCRQPRPSGLYQIIKLICRGLPGLLECEADLNGCTSSQMSVRGHMVARKAPIYLPGKLKSVVHLTGSLTVHLISGEANWWIRIEFL